ncbi:MAG: pyridoxal phosphate-dependent aminotransferase [Bacteroidia bacterium]
MNRVSDRLMALSESETLAMARRTRELTAKGHHVVSLSLGEPDYDTPEFIKKAAKNAIDENYSHYTPVAGYQDLREAISRKFKRDNNLNYSPSQIVVSTGAKQSIANVVMSLINPGDEVLLPAPYWVSYIEIIKLAGGIPKIIYAGIDQDYKITPAQLEANISSASRLMIFSSPCNPTGSVYSEEELRALARIIQKQPELYVIADEIYEHIRFGIPHFSIAAIDGMAERTVTVNGLSKGFAMTGWRLGYIGAPDWIAAACDKFQGQITSATCSITQRAAIAALDSDPSVIAPMVEGFSKRRNLMLGLLRQIDGIRVNEPEGAFYFFPDVSAFYGKKTPDGTTIENSIDLSMYLLNHSHLALVGGSAFGCNNSVRLSYATSEDVLTEAVKRLKSGLEQLS